MKLIDQFTRVYIVNLPDRSDRRREMEIELARNGLSVDANKIRYFNAVRPDDAGLFPSIGARGCFLSHLGILNEAIKDDLDNVLVMEDDLSIDDRFSETQSEMCLVLQNGQWDFAYIGHVEPLLDNNLPPVWEWTNKPLATTHFYAVNRPVMRPLRDYLESCLNRQPGDPFGGPMHVDGAYSLFRMHHPEVQTLISVPSLGGQRSSRSDIFPNKWYDKTGGFIQLASIFRGLKNIGKRILK